VFNINLAFTLALSGMKCNLPFPSEQKPAETMTTARLHTAKLAEDCMDCYQMQ